MLLLIDGNYLLKRNFSKSPEDCIFTFVSTVRRLVSSLYADKCVVFWDAEDGGVLRYNEYPIYKSNREGKSWAAKQLTESKANEIIHNKQLMENRRYRIMEYLDHLFIRQCIVEKHEADDLIYEACKSYSGNSRTVLFTNDRDLTQILLLPKTEIILAGQNMKDENENFLTYSKNSIKDVIGTCVENITYLKAFLGDNSDNIKGAFGVGESLFWKIFDNKKPIPSLEYAKARIEEYYKANPSKTTFSLNYFLQKEHFEHLKDIKKYDYDPNHKEIIEKAKLKAGIPSSIELNYRLVDLSCQNYITEEAKDKVAEAIENPFSLEGRGGKTLFPLMLTDNFLQKIGLRWTDQNRGNPMAIQKFTEYTQPFMLLIESEKKYSKKFI